MMVGMATSAVTPMLLQKALLWSTWLYSENPAYTDPPTRGVRCRLSHRA